MGEHRLTEKREDVPDNFLKREIRFKFESSSEQFPIAIKKNADLCEDSDWQDHHFGGGAI